MSAWKLLAAAAVLAASFGTASAENQPAAIRFGGFGQGFGQPYGVAVLAIAQGKGFIDEEFKNTPTKITYEYFTGTGPAINEAIANSRLDFAQYGALPNIIGKAAGLPTRIVASYGETAVFGIARADLPISGFKDLVGKRVAVAKGTILHWALLKALEGNGLTLRDITLVDLKTADQLAALAAKSIDAVVGTSTHLVLRDNGIGKVFYASRELGPKASGFGAITVTEQFEAQYPEATQKVVRGLVRAAHWLGDEQNREEALRIWSKSGVRYESLKSEFEGFPLKTAFDPRIDEFYVSQYRGGIEFTKEQKLIRAGIDADKWFAPKYVEQALSDLKLEKFWAKRTVDGVSLSQ